MIKVTGNKVDIELLWEALYYSLTHVLIVPTTKMYRLYAITTNRIDFRHSYDTIIGAKVSFRNRYQSKLLDCVARQNIGNTWFKLSVDVEWLMDRIGWNEMRFLMNQLKAS